MSIPYSLAVSVVALLPLAAAAEQAQKQPDPADAKATVPALAYQSGFQQYKAVSGDDVPSPDTTWVQANQNVAGKSGSAKKPSGKPAGMDHDSHAMPMSHSHDHGEGH